MKRQVRSAALCSRGIWSAIAVANLLVPTVSTTAQEARVTGPSDSEELALETAAAVTGLFQEVRDRVWPGYDLSTRPLTIYVPDLWVLVLNAVEPLGGFDPCPESWPPFPTSCQVRQGRYGGLAGELAFDVDISGLRTVVIPIARGLIPPDHPHPRLYCFAFVVHEAFHQFQRETFASMETEPEERYPMLDPDNTALAVLEMRLLADALAVNHPDSLRPVVTSWVALRRRRWARADPFVREFESKIERLEGTAKYVEVENTALLRQICPRGVRPTLLGAICAEAESLTAETILLAEFHERLPGPTLSPADVARNRVYPVGASLCVLLDRLGASWKDRAAELEGDSSLVGLLEEGLAKVPAGETQSLDELKRRYGFEAIVRATCDSIDAYVDGYRKAIAEFESQPGYRIKVSITKSGVTRSRSSLGRRWVIDEGADVFGERYVTYTLKRRGANEFSLEVHESGVLDHTDGERNRRIVTFIAPALDTCDVDGSAVNLDQDGTYIYDELLLVGDGFSWHSVGRGTIVIRGRSITVEEG